MTPLWGGRADMPDLDSRIHLDMLRRFKRQNSLLFRLKTTVKESSSFRRLYGLEWGDPESVPPLKFVRDRYVLPYVNPEHVALEIGPGGGRWTRYLLGFRTLYVLDYYVELLAELRKNFRQSNMIFIRNNGTDFPGVAEQSVNFVFSFGCFVHLDRHLIATYLDNICHILKAGGNVLIQYSDKSKIMAQINPGFSDNEPEQMRQMVLKAGFKILEEDLTTMWHSSLIRFTR